VLVTERRHSVPSCVGTLGRLGSSRQGLPPGLGSDHGHVLLSAAEQIPMGQISCRLVPDLCQEGFPPAAWTKATASSMLISPGDWQEPLILIIPIPLTCSLSLLSVMSAPECPRDTSPHPAAKGSLQEPHRGAKRDLPGGEFSTTSAW